MKIKFLLISVVTLLSSFYVSAGRHMTGGDEDFTPTEDMTHYPAMILVTDGDMDEALASLESEGVIVLRHRGDIILALIPLEKENEVRKVRGIKRVERSKPRFNTPTMKEARLFNNANWINEGYNLSGPFDGRGVVVGICDIGMDTRHPNFLNSTLDESRIRRVVHYEELQGRRTQYDDPQQIYDWQTDDPEEWHATHVAGIAAGGLKESEYYGLASAADIVFTGSQLSDVGLLAGVEDIIEYAKSVGKPAVINLSMGNYTGPHDGTSLFSQYLDMCADDAIICLSAGNEGRGDTPKSMSFDFTESQREVRVRPNDWGGTDYTGEAEVWSLDDTPFTFTFYWRSSTNANGNLYAYEALKSTDGELVTKRICVDPDDPDYDATMAAHYKAGEVIMTVGISPLNGRYYANLQFALQTDELHGSDAWSEYWTAMKIEGEPGAHVDIFCGGGSFLRAERGQPAPDNSLCFSDLATGKRVISVGMTNNTPLYEGAEPGTGYGKGDVSIDSSYGTLIDGRKMPVTVAPGGNVISSISSAYLEKYPEDIPYTDFSMDVNGQTVYWVYNYGTSMACPFVVGAIATWLQAYPQLTSDEALDIVLQTNVTSGLPVPDDPRHGRGWFNAYAGMQKILELAALNVGSVDDETVTLRVERGRVYIANQSGEPVMVNVYSLSGQIMETLTVEETLYTYEIANLPAGVYMVNVKPRGGAGKTVKVIGG